MLEAESGFQKIFVIREGIEIVSIQFGTVELNNLWVKLDYQRFLVSTWETFWPGGLHGIKLLGIYG